MYLTDIESCVERFGSYHGRDVKVKLTGRGLYSAEVKGRFLVSASLSDLMRKVELTRVNIW